jgi:hypothetical protein
MSDDIKKEFDIDSNVTYEEILKSLLTKKDLELKTDVKSPQKLAGLKIIAKHADKYKLDLANDLFEYIDILNEFMVSYNRKSRKEIVDAVKSMFEKRSTSISLSERLTTNRAR